MSSPLLPRESAWQTLRGTLEWAQEFGLVFFFCSDRFAIEDLFKRANDLMLTQVRPFQRFEAKQADSLVPELLPLAINPTQTDVEMGMPLWLGLGGHTGDPAWDHARREFLQRLNERRATMAREHHRTVVLVLPLDWTKQAAEAAPDLWTIRQPSVYLDTSGTAQALPAQTQETAPVQPTGELPATVLRWMAARDGRQAPLSPWSATQAAEAALKTGHTELAWVIAQATVDQLRGQMKERGETPKSLRDLSISMSLLGDVAHALGRLDEAQLAYRESEALHRALITDFGKTPERLRDLSISINKLGDVAHSLGRPDEAQLAYRESETLDRGLISDFGKTPERLRNLSVSVGKLGDVAHALGQLDEAQLAYRESETLRRALISDFGKTPERLRDLSVSVGKLGDVAHALGQLDEAQLAYRESETLRRALISDFGKTPERLRDLSVSVGKLGDVARALGRLDEAQLAFETAIDVATELVEAYGETGSALDMLASSEMKLGLTLAQLDRIDEADRHCARARRLYQRLVHVFPHESRCKAALAELQTLELAALSKGDN